LPSTGSRRARPTIFEEVTAVTAGVGPKATQDEQSGEQSSRVDEAVPVVVVIVLGFPLHAVIVLHCVVDFVWTVVLEPMTEVKSSTFSVQIGIGFELH
jgi:hypothetical protein